MRPLAFGASILAMLITAAPASAQQRPRYSGPDDPAAEAAARAALPSADVRTIKGEIRRIEGIRAVIAGEVQTLAAVERSLRIGGLETRTVEGGLEVILPGDVLFDFDKAVIRTSAVPIMEQIASAARSTGDRALRVEGHTDAIGQPAYNQRLSQARAQAVSDWLVRSGIPANRIGARGFGATRPVAPNKTQTGADDPAGRQKNRRVTVIFAG